MVSAQEVPIESIFQNNASLTSLTISSCPNLLSIPSTLGYLTALKSLIIRWCKRLVNLPEDSYTRFTRTQVLIRENCNNITYLPTGLQHFTSVEHLVIMYIPVLDHLPAELSNLSKLSSLYILSCQKLSFLPESLKHVTSLQTLEIHKCHGIKSLPEDLTNLSNLQHLSIRQCSALEVCGEGLDRDWPKIAQFTTMIFLFHFIYPAEISYSSMQLKSLIHRVMTQRITNFSLKMWNITGLWGSVQHALTSTVSVTDPIFSLLEQLSVELAQRMATVFWSIWKHQNLRVWDNVIETSATVVECARNMVVD
ncbi:target of AVRB operation protein, putative [Medicago truncatula]|uniref:Target of AVRB operation protein, putative n=1 Tax=Medicago truncatula TaxID=3880 RepID=G7KM60_MEDTR|nr:target of AVRB operation protein, putative [Medicago truncatula]